MKTKIIKKFVITAIINYGNIKHEHPLYKNIGTVHSICNIMYKKPKKFPVVFHNGSEFEYYFIIKDFAE